MYLSSLCIAADHIVTTIHTVMHLFYMINVAFCFPRISMFPETKSRETLRFEGNKIHCSPRDQSLGVNCHTDMAKRSLAVLSDITLYFCV